MSSFDDDRDDDDWDPKKHARASDPDTSLRSAKSEKEVAKQQQLQILKLFTDNPGLCVRDDEGAAMMRWPEDRYRKRRSDLKTGGELEHHGESKGPSGKMRKCWRLAKGQRSLL